MRGRPELIMPGLADAMGLSRGTALASTVPIAALKRAAAQTTDAAQRVLPPPC